MFTDCSNCASCSRIVQIVSRSSGWSGLGYWSHSPVEVGTLRIPWYSLTLICHWCQRDVRQHARCLLFGLSGPIYVDLVSSASSWYLSCTGSITVEFCQVLTVRQGLPQSTILKHSSQVGPGEFNRVKLFIE